MLIRDFVAPLYKAMLTGLRTQLQKADAHMGADNHRFRELLDRRLIADMHPLSAQIEFTCLQTHEVVGRLFRSEWRRPAAPTTLNEAEEMIAAAIDRLEDGGLRDLGSDKTDHVRLELAEGLVFELSADEYVRDWAVPQFHFHLVSAYAIMRSAGVPLGKADYVGHMFQYLASPSQDISR